MEWSDEVIAQLRALWADGLSTAEIGRRLGVTKNAIVGKAHRLDLPARPSPIRRDPDAVPPRRSTVRRVEGPTLPPLPSTFCGATEAEPPPAQLAAPILVAAPGPVAAPAPVIVPAQVEPAPVRQPVMMRPVPTPVQIQAPRPVVAPPPRPVIVAPPRPAAYASRPTGGRIVTCCWPLGEPGTKDFTFCDAPSDPGRPYCEEHVKVAYVRVRDRREDAA